MNGARFRKGKRQCPWTKVEEPDHTLDSMSKKQKIGRYFIGWPKIKNCNQWQKARAPLAVGKFKRKKRERLCSEGPFLGLAIHRHSKPLRNKKAW